MQILIRRYTRSGYGPRWFHMALAIGFAAMAAWAFVEQDWIVGAIALVMAPLTIAGARIMRRLSDAARASREAYAQQEEHR